MLKHPNFMSETACIKNSEVKIQYKGKEIMSGCTFLERTTKERVRNILEWPVGLWYLTTF